MIGLDTNVLVRYLAQDDAVAVEEGDGAYGVPDGGASGYVSQVALVEVVWVLGRCYGVGREQMKDIIDSMIGTKELVVEGADTVRKALRVFACFCKGGFRGLPDRAVGARRRVRVHGDFRRERVEGRRHAVDCVTTAWPDNGEQMNSPEQNKVYGFTFATGTVRKLRYEGLGKWMMPVWTDPLSGERSRSTRLK
jgi:predicted nucleic-acid-binding protein